MVFLLYFLGQCPLHCISLRRHILMNKKYFFYLNLMFCSVLIQCELKVV